MSQTTDTPKAKPLGWARILLFASLAFNMLIAGLVAGAMLRADRFDRDDARRSDLREFGYGPYGQAFSKTDRREIARGMRERAGDLGANRAEVRQQLNDFLVALRTSPFQPALVQELVISQQNKLLERQELGRDLLLERIYAMSDAERAAFADRLEKSLRRRSERWR